MKIEIQQLTEGKRGSDEIPFDGTTLPVAALEKLIKDGYQYLNFYPNNKTFSLWGKTATACLSEEQIRARDMPSPLGGNK